MHKPPSKSFVVPLTLFKSLLPSRFRLNSHFYLFIYLFLLIFRPQNVLKLFLRLWQFGDIFPLELQPSCCAQLIFRGFLPWGFKPFKFPGGLTSTSYRLLPITGVLTYHQEGCILSGIRAILFAQFFWEITAYGQWSFPKITPQMIRLGRPNPWLAGAYLISMHWAPGLACKWEMSRYVVIE